MQRKAETSTMRRLIFVAVMLGAVCFAAVIVRLFKLQVLDFGFYQKEAVTQQTKDKTLYPVRGAIYDRNMKALAISTGTEMVTLEAVKIEDDKQGQLIAETLSEILALDYDTVLAKVNKRSTYEVIKRGVDKETADKIRAFIKENKINSIYLVSDSSRSYPYGNFLSHVLGFVGTDQQGLYGLEKQYDDVLSGTPGRVITATNARGEEMPFQYEMYYEAEDGRSLVLTIDEVLQHYLEKNLEIALNDNKVQNKVTGIVMDVNTGGILAMATLPDFDLNDPFTITDAKEAARLASITDPDERREERSIILNAQWRNKAISDAYYPGSTFKIVTMSVGLEEGKVSLNSHFYCGGSKKIEGWSKPINCWKRGGHGDQNLAMAIKNSCNPAFMEIGQSIGWRTFEEYYEAFGLKDKTGIDLPGESTGVFFSTRSIVDLAVLSFGQNFSVTPLQLITAVSAVANGGTLLKPYLVQSVLDAEGNTVASCGRTEVRQVISADTSALMADLLEGVVTTGTGKNAYTAGYRVAGKTGTSEKKDKEALTGDDSLRISSFVAFAPADDPQIAVLIILDEPTVQPVTGGLTVAPVIRRFMEEAMPYLNVEPQYTEAELQQKDETVPSVKGMGRAEAETALKNAGLSSRTSGSGDTVTDQIPAAGAVVARNSTVILYMGESVPDKLITMPNVRGMSLNQAKSALQDRGLYVRITGVTNTKEGNLAVTKQSIEAETQVAFGTVVTLEISDMDQRAE